MLNEVVISFDTDWCCDAIIDTVAYLALDLGCRATWFITHDSPAIRRLMLHKEFEIGLHPNFLQGSTQGNAPGKIMETLKSIATDAISVRSHAMVYSAQICRMFSFYNMQIDSSMYLGGMPGIRPIVSQYADGRKLVKLPYYWSDDGALSMTSRFPNDQTGLQIYCFHPIHVFLNTTRWEDYIRYKSEASEAAKAGLMAPDDLDRYRNFSEFGIRQCFYFATKRQKGKSRTLKQLVEEEKLNDQ